MAKTEKIDIYATITNRVIEALEAGVRPWMQPWKGGSTAEVTLPLRHNGIPYKGVNIFLLWWEAVMQGYESPYWMTFNQAKKYGGSVRKGSKGTVVVYSSKFLKEVENKKGEKETKAIPYLKYSYVFNVAQIEGLPEKFAPTEKVEMTAENAKQRLDHAEAYFKACGADLRHGGNRAFFNVANDFIQMPRFEAFHTVEGYYATLGHEHIHWTGAEKRLNRKFGNGLVDKESYAKEELVAELGSAFLCAVLGLTPEIRDDHAAYVAGWLKALNNDKRLIFQVSSKAQAAVSFLQKLNGIEDVKEEESQEDEEKAA